MRHLCRHTDSSAVQRDKRVGPRRYTDDRAGVQVVVQPSSFCAHQQISPQQRSTQQWISILLSSRFCAQQQILRSAADFVSSRFQLAVDFNSAQQQSAQQQIFRSAADFVWILLSSGFFAQQWFTQQQSAQQ